MQTRFILIHTSHAGNVGAAARAIKTMGFDDMVLVAPRWANVLRREETIQRASGANDVLNKCRIVETLDDALEGITHLCATAMTPRDFGPPTRGPREHFQAIKDHAMKSQNAERGIAFLFGSERFGMANEDVYRCHVALQIPTNPKFGSLNLASAVQLIAYEWRQVLGFNGDEVPTNPQTNPDANIEKLADAKQIADLLTHWEESLAHIGYLDPLKPRKLMPRLQQLFNRAQLRDEEIHILRGVAKAMLKQDT